MAKPAIDTGAGSVLTSVSYELLQPVKRRYINLYLAVGLAVFGMLAWSSQVKLDVMIFGPGKVVPASSVQMVQHFEGGIVSEINVKSGAQVKAGDVLLRVDNVNFNTDLGEARQQLQATVAQISRLNAEIEGKPFTLAAAQGAAAEDAQLIAREQQIYQQRQADLKQSLASFNQQIAKNKQEQRQLRGQLSLLASNQRLMKQEIALSEELVAAEALSPMELLRMRRSLHEMQVERQRTESQRLAKQNEANRLAQSSDERKAQFVSEALQQRNELENQRAALVERIAAASDRVSRSDVIAPVDGTVNRVLVSTVGGVVQSGMDLVEIVPNDASLLIETRILPEDIAFIRPDQSAVVRITAYDFAVFGSLQGKVVNIGADTVEEDDGSQFYTVQIKTDRASLDKAGQQKIIAGMRAQVDVITGKRSLLSYLAKPLAKAKQRALREQ